MAASCLSADHNVYLAYREPRIGGRFDIEKQRLPFFFEVDPFTIVRLIAIIRRKKIDVLIATKKKDYALAGIAGRLCGTKTVLRLGIVRRMRNLCHHLVYNRLADGIIVNAAIIKDVLLTSTFMRADRIRVIYNGLDMRQLSKKSRSEDSCARPFPFLVSAMGRVTELKGFDYLLKGFALFIHRSSAEDAGLVIVGDGAYLPSLKELARSLEISDKVIFTGFLENPYPLLAATDVFAMTSRNEGISNALIEAMYLENAVISTVAGGVKEIISSGENGQLVDYGDVPALGGFLEALYENEGERKRLAAAARGTVSDRFSVERMKEEIERFCNEI